MKPALLLASLLIAASFPSLSAQSPAAAPSIGEVAQCYGAQAQEVINHYNQLYDQDRFNALGAVEALAAKRAYPVLAMALLTVNENVKPAIVEALRGATVRDKLIISSLSLELSNRNVITPPMTGGEVATGQSVMKRKLIRLLAKQTGVDASQVDEDNHEQVAAFVASVTAANQ